MHSESSTSKPVNKTTEVQLTPHQSGVVDKLWLVEVKIIGTAYSQKWRGYAPSEDEARTRGYKAAGLAWPGFSRCIQSAQRVHP